MEEKENKLKKEQEEILKDVVKGILFQHKKVVSLATDTENHIISK